MFCSGKKEDTAIISPIYKRVSNTEFSSSWNLDVFL